VTEEAAVEQGAVAAALREEFPELQVLSCEVPAPAGRTSDPGTRERLALLAARMRGGRAVELRREPVPAAYRVFYRHIGIDPDSTRTPVEEAAIARLVEGGHRSRGRLADALLLALLDTGVLVNAIDAGTLDGVPGLRAAAAGERLGEEPQTPPLGAGRLVLADARRALGALFGDLAPDVVPGRRTERLRLVAVRIPGVPSIHVEEALWACQESLAAGAPE
jgi:DNA/RNA-binding domain of Phe-tRNA-synthetase-like protein